MENIEDEGSEEEVSLENLPILRRAPPCLGGAGWGAEVLAGLCWVHDWHSCSLIRTREKGVIIMMMVMKVVIIMVVEEAILFEAKVRLDGKDGK